MYYLQSRYYDPEVGRFVSADDVAILEVQNDLYDKNLFAYCDNNPISRVDKYGNLWQKAVLLGGKTIALGYGVSLSSIATSIMAGLGAITPLGWTIIAIVAVGASGYAIYRMSKGGKQRILDSGLTGVSDEEIDARYKDPSTSVKERQRLKKEQKARQKRNIQKRENNDKNNEKKEKR